MGNGIQGRVGKRTEGGSQRPGATARDQIDTTRRCAEGVVRRAAYAGKLHDTRDSGQMEADRGRRTMPLGHQDRQVHNAGVHDEHGELNGYEQNSSRTMSDDNLKMFKVGDVTMFCRRLMISLINFEDEMEQHQQYEHLHFLGHSQVHLGQSSSRRPNSVNKGGFSRNRLRPGDDHDKNSAQKEMNKQTKESTLQDRGGV
eukprot:1294890-Heterocapsa_arctica.AAC.1